DIFGSRMAGHALKARLAVQADQPVGVPVAGMDAALFAEDQEPVGDLLAEQVNQRLQDVGGRLLAAHPVQDDGGQAATSSEVKLDGRLARKRPRLEGNRRLEVRDQALGVAEVERSQREVDRVAAEVGQAAVAEVEPA